MPRDLSQDAIDALSERDIRLEYLYEGNFINEILRLWSGMGDLSWDSETWLGNGWFVGPSSVRESSAIVANGFSIKLSGVPTTLRELALNRVSETKTGILYVALFDADGDIIDAHGYSGDLDQVRISESNNALSITISYESKLRRLKKSREIRLTNEYQQVVYPGDRGLEQAIQVKQKRLYWGRPDPGRWGG